MADRFVSEPIKPVVATCDTSRMSMGEPGLPRQFVWRGRMVEIAALLRTWHETGKCRHGSDDRYVRKHWYQVATIADGTMTIYFEKNPLHGRKGKGWWLFSIDDAPLAAGPGAGTCRPGKPELNE